MQELLLGSLGIQIVAFIGRHFWQVSAGVLVVSLIVIELLRKNGSSAGGDVDLSGLDFGGCDGDGDCGGD
jgi:hypothetical protein